MLWSLQDEVKASYSFARYAQMLAHGIRPAQEEGNSQQEQQVDAERDISKMTAVGFYAGWLKGQEYEDARQSARNMTGTVDELVALLLSKRLYARHASRSCAIPN